MGISSTLAREFGRAERREEAVFSALPLLLLAASALISLLQLGELGRPVPVLVLTGACAIWLLGWVRARPALRGRPAAAGTHVAGLMGMGAVLVLLAPWYGIFALTGYLHGYSYLRGPGRVLAALATSAIMAVAYLGGIARIEPGEVWLWLAISVLSTALAVAAYRLTDAAEQRADTQRRALVALEEAHRRLQEATDANAALQAQLLDQARESGTLAERQRVAREIHDTIAQGLAGILTQLQAAEPALPPGSAARDRVLTAERLARESLVEARRTVRALGPEQLERGTLREALEEITDAWSDAHGIHVELTVTGAERTLPQEAEAALLRVAQEALANVAKHARAEHVALSLVHALQRVVLEVRDDGDGFESETRAPADEEADGEGGFGLRGMRQRLEAHGGRLVIDAAPGRGTALCATLPG